MNRAPSMTGKKRAHSPTSTYKLKVFRFSKLYDSKSKDGPAVRSGHRIVCNDRSMIAIGGFNPRARSRSPGGSRIVTGPAVYYEIWRFDFDSRKWTTVEFKNMTKDLASFATTMSGNLLFLHGGTGVPFGYTINEDVYVCRMFSPEPVLEFNQINVEGSTKPPKHYGQSIVIRGTYLYTVGGTDGFAYSMDVYRLDLRTNVWEKLTSKYSCVEDPQPRYRHEMVLYNDYLVVLGGGTSNAAYGLKEIPAFNLKSRCWETFVTIGDDNQPDDAYPKDRRCHACVQNPHDPAIVFVNGGISDNDSFSDTWRLDLRTLKWTMIDTLHLPYSLFFHTAASTPEGKMVIFGGVTRKNGNDVRTADVYSSWITIPKLKHACWDAVLHYVRNGTIRIPENAEKLGLPAPFEARLKQCL